MSDPIIEAAAPKETAKPVTPAPAAPPAPSPIAATPPPTPAPPPAPIAAPPPPPPAAPVPDVTAKVKELDEALARINAREKAERNKRVVARLRAMGAIASESTLLLLAGDADPDTADGIAKLDRIRELEPLLFRSIAADTRTVVESAISAKKAPDTYKGRFNDEYAKRLAAGAIRRANGGE